MIQGRVDIDYETLRRRLGDLHTKVIPFIRVSMEEIAKKGVSIISDYTPRSDEPGQHIADLWDYKKTRKAASEEFIISNLYPDQDILLYLEEGTKAHEIVPRYKKVLRFEVDSGRVVFAKKVYHPGTRPYKMVEQGQEKVDNLVDSYINLTFKMIDQLQGV